MTRPTKPIGPGQRRGGTAEQHDPQRRYAAGQADALAEAAGDVVAEGEAVEDAAGSQDDERADGEERQAREHHGPVAAREPPTCQKRNRSRVSWLETG